jgi:RNA polymerase sigma factor (TIGR02999 family)
MSETLSPALQASGTALFDSVYARLKAMASRQLVQRPSATLSTTALVHEAYLKLCAGRELKFESPLQFFDYASQAMRHILVDRAREHLTAKRGKDPVKTQLDSKIPQGDTATHALELDDALRRLEREDQRAARLVALHYFAGLSLPEIAQMMGVTSRTLNRDWRFARAFLRHQLE